MTYQHFTNRHESFEYNSYEAREYLVPQRSKTDTNIKGIELEISDLTDPTSVNSQIDKVIDKKIVCSYDTMYEYSRKYANCIWTYDGTVEQGELVIQAERPRNLALKMKMLNKYLNPDTVNNTSGTSVHIHMNNQYLRNLDMEDIDMIKAGESIASTLYSISGRHTLAELNDYVKTRLDVPYTMPIALRCKYIDALTIDPHLDYERNPGHYMMINIQNNNTTEIRMFSNYHNFNYDRIKLFLESCDMIKDIALAMKDLSYATNYEIVLDIVQDFYTKNRRRKKYLSEINDSILSDKRIIREYEMSRIIEDINKRFERVMYSVDEDYRYINTLRALRDISTQYGVTYDGMIDLNSSSIDIDEIRTTLQAQLLRNL